MRPSRPSVPPVLRYTVRLLPLAVALLLSGCLVVTCRV